MAYVGFCVGIAANPLFSFLRNCPSKPLADSQVGIYLEELLGRSLPTSPNYVVCVHLRYK